MRQTLTVTTSPSIVVIQQAYREVYATTEGGSVEAIYDVDRMIAGALIIAARQEIALPTLPPVTDWLRFQQLVADWRRERGATSSITEAALCPAYQEIIGMGQQALPLILAQLESEGDEPDQWFWALKAITGEDPVSDESRGDFVAMAKCWLNWGRAMAHAW